MTTDGDRHQRRLKSDTASVAQGEIPATASADITAEGMTTDEGIGLGGNGDEKEEEKEEGIGVAGSGLNAIRNAIRSRGSNSNNSGGLAGTMGSDPPLIEREGERSVPQNNGNSNNVAPLHSSSPLLLGTEEGVEEDRAASLSEEKEEKKRRFSEIKAAREKARKYLENLTSKQKAKEEQVTKYALPYPEVL